VMTVRLLAISLPRHFAMTVRGSCIVVPLCVAECGMLASAEWAGVWASRFAVFALGWRCATDVFGFSDFNPYGVDGVLTDGAERVALTAHDAPFAEPYSGFGRQRLQ